MEGSYLPKKLMKEIEGLGFNPESLQLELSAKDPNIAFLIEHVHLPNSHRELTFLIMVHPFQNPADAGIALITVANGHFHSNDNKIHFADNLKYCPSLEDMPGREKMIGKLLKKILVKNGNIGKLMLPDQAKEVLEKELSRLGFGSNRPEITEYNDRDLPSAISLIERPKDVPVFVGNCLFEFYLGWNENKLPYIQAIDASFLDYGPFKTVAIKNYQVENGALPSKTEMYKALNEVYTIQRIKDRFDLHDVGLSKGEKQETTTKRGLHR